MIVKVLVSILTIGVVSLAAGYAAVSANNAQSSSSAGNGQASANASGGNGQSSSSSSAGNGRASASATGYAKDQCKSGGWQSMGFRNQGQCVSTFASSSSSAN